MGLFLAKLLPLFIYPVGLVTVLVGGMAVWAWRIRSPLQWPLLFTLVLLLVTGNTWMSAALIQSLEWQYLPSPTLDPAPAIVVLGGALHSHTYPRPFAEVTEAGDRPIYAAQLYLDGKAPIIIASGGRIPWWGTFDQSEAADMAALMQRLGVPPEAILEEGASLNTHENAVNTRQLLQPKGIDRIILVTSAYHMPRAKHIFEIQGFTVIPAPTDFLTNAQSTVPINWATVPLSLIPSVENLERTTLALKEWIGWVVYRLTVG